MWTVNTFYGITEDLSEERVRDYAKDISGYSSLARKLEEFAQLDATYVRTFLSGRGYGENLFTIRMIEAHGRSDKEKRLQYADLRDEKLVWNPVDDWLDEHEDRYDVLYVSCCNEGKVVLRPRKSILIYPLGEYKGSNLIKEALKESIADMLQVVKASP